MHYILLILAPAARDRFIIDLRGPRPRTIRGAPRISIEDEPTSAARRAGRHRVSHRPRCPWRCAMCDLWRFTTREDTPAGAIPAQFAAARRWRERGEKISRIKLYNASNFFDPRAVPEAITARSARNSRARSGHRRVASVAHRARVDRFRDALGGRRSRSRWASRPRIRRRSTRLNKRMTIDDFARAPGSCGAAASRVRVFLLISALRPARGTGPWLLQSVEFAERAGPRPSR